MMLQLCGPDIAVVAVVAQQWLCSICRLLVVLPPLPQLCSLCWPLMLLLRGKYLAVWFVAVGVVNPAAVMRPLFGCC
jgi:hypothetical protein